MGHISLVPIFATKVMKSVIFKKINMTLNFSRKVLKIIFSPKIFYFGANFLF